VAPPTPLQIVRRLLGIPQRVAVGGSRSSAALAVCLVSPTITGTTANPNAAGHIPQPLAVVPLPTPTLLVAGPLSEIRLERGGVILWRQLASSTQPISGPISWPLPPLQPDESLDLRLRPLGASGADFAAISLKTASAAELERQRTVIQALGNSQERWVQAIDGVANADPALAVALLTTPEAPAAVRASAAGLTCAAPATP
jgi:hypothetical protein